MKKLEEYAKLNGFKPLTSKEVKEKYKVKIYGTQDPLPWTEVYTRLSAGMSIDDVVHIYGQARKITLFALKDGIDINPVLSQTLDDEILQRRKMNEIEKSNPEVARTMKEMVNEYAPDVARDVIMLSKKLVQRATDIIDDKDDACTTNDLKNIAAAVQTMTDTIELTQRHGAGVQVNAGNIQVEGFSFVLDAPPVDAEIIDE